MKVKEVKEFNLDIVWHQDRLAEEQYHKKLVDDALWLACKKLMPFSDEVSLLCLRDDLIREAKRNAEKQLYC
jgi:hypothetical protein